MLLTYGKRLHGSITLLRGEVWAHEASLTLPLVIEVQSQESERSYICVLGYQFCFCFCDSSIRFWNYSDSVVFLFFIFKLTHVYFIIHKSIYKIKTKNKKHTDVNIQEILRLYKLYMYYTSQVRWWNIHVKFYFYHC